MNASLLRSPWLCATALLVALAVPQADHLSAALAGDEATTDWQTWADRQAWSFEDDEAQPLFCALKRNAPFVAYEIRLRVLKGGNSVGIDVVEEGTVRYAWTGHRNSVFVIRERRLYYVEFGRSSSGAALVAVDLETGTVLWRNACRGIGPVGHSGYRNLVNLDVTDEVAVVRGKESLGRYLEVKRLQDGRTLGHRRFAAEE